MMTHSSWRSFALCGALSLAVVWLPCRSARAQDPQASQAGPPALVHKVQGSADRVVMTVNTSRILTLDQDIPFARSENPEIVSLTALSTRQIQMSGRRAGVATVNLRDAQGMFHTIDVIVYGDTRELSMLLQSEFPKASLRLIPLQNGLLLTGYLDDPNEMSQIVNLASQFSPSIINNIRIGGVQQVLLKVKVMEVSRTKLRSLGFDFSDLSPTTFVASGVSGMMRGVASPLTGTLDATSITGNVLTPGVSSAGQNFSFGVVNANQGFFGFLEMLRQNNVAKVLAEPNLVTVSGRPASFNSGGEFPILVPQSLGTVSIQYRSFGTQVDFVPIVLGNGSIRLEVRPRVSEIDDTRGVTINSITVPALRVRQVDTGVEMQPGQTLAIAGLVQTRSEAQSTGIPYLADLPYVGALFRRNRENMNEIELLILVTPYLASAMDAHEVPCGGPGLNTQSPNDWQLYFKGNIEVPRQPAPMIIGSDSPMDQTELPTNGYLPAPQPETVPPGPVSKPKANGASPLDTQPLPEAAPMARPRARPVAPVPATTVSKRTSPASNPLRAATAPSGSDTGSRYNRPQPNDRQTPATTARSGSTPGFIGPLGYDVVN